MVDKKKVAFGILLALGIETSGLAADVTETVDVLNDNGANTEYKVVDVVNTDEPVSDVGVLEHSAVYDVVIPDDAEKEQHVPIAPEVSKAPEEQKDKNESKSDFMPENMSRSEYEELRIENKQRMAEARAEIDAEMMKEINKELKSQIETKLEAEKEAIKADAKNKARLKAKKKAEARSVERELRAEIAKLKAEKEAQKKAQLKVEKEIEAIKLKAEKEAFLEVEKEEAAKVKAEREAKDKADAARAKAEEEAKLKAEREAEAARAEAEHDAKVKEEAARIKAEEEAKLKAEREREPARITAEQDAKVKVVSKSEYETVKILPKGHESEELARQHIFVNDVDYKSIAVANIRNGRIVLGDTDYGVNDNAKERSLRERSDYQLLDYVNDKEHNVVTNMNKITMIELPFGEAVNNITIGDSLHFDTSTMYDKGAECWRIYIQPLQENVSTNMVISTDRRIYNLGLYCVDGEDGKPFVKFVNIPDGGSSGGFITEDGAISLNVENINQLNFGYRCEGRRDFDWSPQNVFDDNVKNTYLNFDRNVLLKYRPVIFTYDENGRIKLLAYTRYKDCLVLDRIYDNLEVRVGANSTRFIRNKR